VLELLHFALTNTPAIDGFKPVGAASILPIVNMENRSMNKVFAALNLPEDADEAAVLEAIAALTGERDELRAKLEQAQTAAGSSAPLALVQQLQGEIAALKAGETKREVDGLIAAGMADGRILPSMEAWARNLAAVSTASLKEFLAEASPIAALAASQTGGKPPAGVERADEFGGDAEAKSAYDRAVASGRVKITGGMS
jgi:phage I-like protein